MTINHAQVGSVARTRGLVQLRRRHADVLQRRQRFRITGRRHFRPRLVGANQRATPRGVFLRQQTFQRHIDELGIAKMMVAVGECQIDRFGDDVDVLRRVVPHRLQVVTLEDVQRHRQCRPLRPRSAGVQFDVAELRFHRRFEIDLEVGKVVVTHQAALLADPLGDGMRDVALVERIARRLQPGLAALAFPAPFFIHHVFQRAAEIGLHKLPARHWRLAARQVHLLARRPAGIVVDVAADELGHQRIHRKTLAGETDRRTGNLAETHGAET